MLIDTLECFNAYWGIISPPCSRMLTLCNVVKSIVLVYIIRGVGNRKRDISNAT